MPSARPAEQKAARPPADETSRDAGGSVNTGLLFFASSIGLGLTLVVASPAEGPLIPPTVAKISPEGMQRGTTASFIIEGRSLSDASAVIFDAPGLSAKVAEITDVPEQITGPRAGDDLGAQVPLGKKQTAKLEITVAKDATPGIHRFRVRTPLGTSNLVVVAVGALPEIKRREAAEMDAGAAPQAVQLPATLIGTITKNGEKQTYRFAGKAGEEIVFSVTASALGSKLASVLVLSDNSGQTLATSAQKADTRDAELNFRLPRTEDYTISIADRDLEGGEGYFYRLEGGDLPFVSGVFPLGVRAGKAAQVSLQGLNLGGLREANVVPPANADGWTTMPLDVVGDGIRPVNEVRLAVGNEPDILESEPNDTIAHAQTVSLPITINGHIDGGAGRSGKPDEDYYRFHAAKGERLSIDVAAARLGPHWTR